MRTDIHHIDMTPKMGKTKLTYRETQEVIKNAKKNYIDAAIAFIENTKNL